MSIYFAGCETQDFIPFGAFTAITNNSGTVAERSTIRASSSFSISSGNKDVSVLRQDLTGNYTDLWATFRHWTGVSTSSTGYMLFSLGKTNKRRIGIGGSGTLGKLSILKVDNANTYTILATESGSFATSTLYKYDIEIIDYGATGTINVYRANADGTSSLLIMTYTGDLTTDSETELGQVFLGAKSTSIEYFSEIIVSDQDTRGMGLVTIEPDGNGNAYDFSGSYTDVSDLNNSTLTSSGTTTAGDLLQVTANTSRLGTPESIEAVVLHALARSGTSLPDLTFNLRLNSIDYFDDTVTPQAVYTRLNAIIEINPDTLNLFAVGDITDAGFNYGLRADL